MGNMQNKTRRRLSDNANPTKQNKLCRRIYRALDICKHTAQKNTRRRNEVIRFLSAAQSVETAIRPYNFCAAQIRSHGEHA